MKLKNFSRQFNFFGRPARCAHPEVVGDVRQFRLGVLDDLSSRPKAATCRRTPKWPAAGKPPTSSGCTAARWGLGLLLAFGWLAVARAGQPRLEVIEFGSQVLQGNPLHDPTDRRVAVFLPSQYAATNPLPIVYYLPGWGGSSEGFIYGQKTWIALTQKFADEVTPVLFVVVNARDRWGGSQYLNSPAQGNYADYVCQEIVREVESHYPAPTNGVRRIIAGHSSGGFGALRLGMARHELFDGVIALSPDSDFPTSHLPLVKLPGVTNATLADVERIEALQAPPPTDGDLGYAVGLSAAYAPKGAAAPGEFEWLYDAQGRFRAEIWQRWLDNDPLTVAQTDPDAFSPNQRIYLDGAAQDEYAANIGARKIYETIRSRPAPSTFYEPPGHHSQHLAARIERGLAWVFGKKMADIK
jgi:enterochelin esterase family protein